MCRRSTGFAFRAECAAHARCGTDSCRFRHMLLPNLTARRPAGALDSLSATRLLSNLKCSIDDRLFEYRTNLIRSARFSGAAHCAAAGAFHDTPAFAITGDIS
jgi:hypothetical protein